jgi:hypothetical protein
MSHEPSLDLILTEVVLPEKSGPSVARSISEGYEPRPALLVMSAFPTPDVPTEAPFHSKAVHGAGVDFASRSGAQERG